MQGWCRMIIEEDHGENLDITNVQPTGYGKEGCKEKAKLCLRSQGRKYYKEKGSGQQALTYVKGQVR